MDIHGVTRMRWSQSMRAVLGVVLVSAVACKDPVLHKVKIRQPPTDTVVCVPNGMVTTLTGAWNATSRAIALAWTTDATNADDKLKKVFNGKAQVNMFDMTKLVNARLS